MKASRGRRCSPPDVDGVVQVQVRCQGGQGGQGGQVVGVVEPLPKDRCLRAAVAKAG